MNKFAIAICNPPYAKNLHLKILEKVITVADEVVNISPCSYVTDKYIDFEKSKEKLRLRNVLIKKLSDLKIFNIKDSNDLFGIGWEGHIGIQTYNAIGGYDYEKFKLKDKLAIKIFEKSFKLPTLYSQFTRKTNSDLFVSIRRRTHRKLKWHSEDSNAREGILFKTSQEKENFIKSLDCWIYNYLNTFEFGEHSGSVPFMKDYSAPWTNERFCKYFDIDGYISDTEAEQGSEWEEILKTMDKFANK